MVKCIMVEVHVRKKNGFLSVPFYRNILFLNGGIKWNIFIKYHIINWNDAQVGVVDTD